MPAPAQRQYVNGMLIKAPQHFIYELWEGIENLQFTGSTMGRIDKIVSDHEVEDKKFESII